MYLDVGYYQTTVLARPSGSIPLVQRQENNKDEHYYNLFQNYLSLLSPSNESMLNIFLCLWFSFNINIIPNQVLCSSYIRIIIEIYSSTLLRKFLKHHSSFYRRCCVPIYWYFVVNSIKRASLF